MHGISGTPFWLKIPAPALSFRHCTWRYRSFLAVDRVVFLHHPELAQRATWPRASGAGGSWPGGFLLSRGSASACSCRRRKPEFRSVTVSFRVCPSYSQLRMDPTPADMNGFFTNLDLVTWVGFGNVTDVNSVAGSLGPRWLWAHRRFGLWRPSPRPT